MHVYGATKQHSLKSGEYTFEFLPKNGVALKGQVTPKSGVLEQGHI